MTLPKVITNAVSAWHDQNGDVPCTADNGKIELMELFRRLFPRKTNVQADFAIKYQVRRVRAIIQPESTRNQFVKKVIGDPTSESSTEMKLRNAISNPIWNPIWNPINAARRKEELNAAALAFYQVNGDHPILSPEEVQAKAWKIISEIIPELAGLTLKQLLTLNYNFTFYAGETKRTLYDEALRWLTERGANLPEGQQYNGQSNRPVLLWNDGSTITMKTAIEQHGFQSVVVYESTYLFDATRVEDAIQTYFQDRLPLGTHKLWRCVAKGRHHDENDCLENSINVYKVFITYSRQVQEKLRLRELKINY